MILKRILKLKGVKQNDFKKYQKQFRINFETWDRLTQKDRIIVLENLIQSDNNIIKDFSELKYNLLPYDLKQQLNKIKIEVF